MNSAMSSECSVISATFQENINKNSNWFVKYAKKNLKPGELAPYHKKMGISQEQYLKLVDCMKNLNIEPTDSFDIMIINDSILSFRHRIQEMKIFLMLFN
jgi:hypothetical protein